MLRRPIYALAAVAVASCAPAAPLRVAVFDDPGFPVFAGSRDTEPAELVRLLHRAGLPADRLTASQLADPGSLSAERYAALIVLCGNTFPLEAAATIERFHRAGGSILATGVPFCHECVRSGLVRWGAVAAGDDRVLPVPGEGRGGSACLRVLHGPTSVWAGVTSARFPAAPGERFTLEGWVKTGPDGGASGHLYVRFFDGAERFLGQWGPALPAQADEWTRLHGEVTAPPDSVGADVCLALFGQGEVSADDLYLRRGDAAPNLLANPGFDDLSEVWQDLGHTNALLGHDGIGMGGFRIVDAGAQMLYRPQGPDPLGVGWLEWPAVTPGHQAVIDPTGFPPEDEVIGIAGPAGADGALAGYSVALVRHRCPQFEGAVDAWMGYPGMAPPQGYQLALAATAAVLRERGTLSPEAADRLLARAREVAAPPARSYRLPDRPVPTERILPGSPEPDRHLLVVHLSQLGPEMELTFRALQGLINRERPRVYVWDRWLDELQAEGYEVEHLQDPLELLRRFPEAYRGAVVYDPDLGASANVALTMAALEGRLPATEAVARALGLEVVTDLRGRFTSDTEAYAWAREHLLPECHGSVVAHIKQAEPLGVAAAQISAGLADYLVAHRIFSFHLRQNFAPEEGAEAERILACYPAHASVIGYFGPEPSGAPNLAAEWEVVSITSALAKGFVFLVNGNLSVHCGLPRPDLQPPMRPLPELRPDKVYVSYYLSDGDSPSTWYGVANHWDDPVRGSLPLGWSLGPATLDVCPLPLARFYSQASELDCFVNSCSGVGYVYPERYGSQVETADDLLARFVRRSAAAAARCRMGMLNVHHYPQVSDATLDRIADGIPGLTGLIAGYGRCAEDYGASHRLSPAGVPVFRCLTTGMGLGMSHEELVEVMARELAEAIPAERPAFVQAFAIYWFAGPEDVKRVVEGAGPDVELVRPDELAELYRAWRRQPR